MATRDALVHLLLVLAACGAQVELDGEDGGEDGPRTGNFPMPALAECGALPDGVEPIPALTSAYVVTGRRPVVNEFVTPDDDVARLRLSSVALGPDDPGTPAPLSSDCGPPGWAFSFDIPPAFLVPGVHALAAMVPHHRESNQTEDRGCYGGESNGYGTEVGELEIFTVTPDCITGEIRGAVDSDDLIQMRNGGFVAQREDVECVPLFGNRECD